MEALVALWLRLTCKAVAVTHSQDLWRHKVVEHHVAIYGKKLKIILIMEAGFVQQKQGIYMIKVYYFEV